MKITEVILPKIIDYYVSDGCAKKIKQTILKSIVEKNGDKLILTADNDFEVFDALRLIRCKTEKVTLGEQRKYEYELDVSAPNAHLFTLKTDYNSNIECTLIGVNNLENSDLRIVFAITKE